MIIQGYNGSNHYAPRIDASTHSLQTIDYPHHETHSGSHFYVKLSVASLGAMTTPDDMITLTWTTPNTTKWGHYQFSAAGSSGWRIRLIEAPTGGASSPTGSVAILNKNRNSSNTSTFVDLSATPNKVSYDATLATGGTTLWDEYITGFRSQGSAGSLRDELILKQNTKYQLSLYGTEANPASVYMNWYEHTDKET